MVIPQEAAGNPTTVHQTSYGHNNGITVQRPWLMYYKSFLDLKYIKVSQT